MINERRRFMRYRVKETVFAALNDPTVIVGQIKDLSMGAAAFEFIPESPEEQQQQGRHTIDIFMLGGTERLSSISCTIAQRQSPRKYPRIFFPTAISRLCVAEFADLPQAKSRELLDFLMRYSVGFSE